jgi:hypothetical protein
MAIVRLKELGQLKKLMTSSGIETATYRFVATTPPRAPNVARIAVQ